MQQVQRLFKDYGLDAKPPKVRRKKGHCWVQLASGPYDLEHNITMLMKVCEGLRHLHQDRSSQFNEHILHKFDATRDLRGSFYAPKDWKMKRKELGQALEREFGMSLRDNGNSFDSCFQYEGKAA